MVIDLSRYAFENLRTDEEFHLYRGCGTGDLPSILVLAPVLQVPDQQTIKRLEREYSFRSELDPKWAVRPIVLAQHWDRTVLVLEDAGGEILESAGGRFVASADGPPGNDLDLTSCLRVAIDLANAIGRLHGRGIVHKNIKPSNVLIDSITGRIWLTGFGIASRLSREKQPAEPPERMAGTFAYMSPEQTGRMNRSIDSRSDLYSFGVLLYEMLTRSLPFTASDPMEWVHCHIARQPVPPDELANVPGPVSAIIMKLLAKTAEDRYQTAGGVIADLQKCLIRWETQGRIDIFRLGQLDTPDRLFIPEKLYGRAREFAQLLASFDRVVTTGRPELVLVSGYSGIGKSSLVNELHKMLVPPRGLFASGKFDQFQRDVPYSTLAQAFQSLIRQLLAKSEAELDRWRNALGEALGASGQVIVDLVPELKHIIGAQPPVAYLPPPEAQNRFQLVLRRFISVFAQPEHPLALFLDDLQWLDAATLELLKDLVTQSDVHDLILIGAYRDNEVTAGHPLMRKLNLIRQSEAQIQEIHLAPLACTDLEQLIAESIRCEPEHARPLAQLVHDKTGGNPFFAVQFISALAEEGLLRFEHEQGRWCWNLGGIHAKGYTDNVVDLMVTKLQRLPAKTYNSLQQLACLGNLANVKILSIIKGKPEQEVHADLWEAVRQELVLRLGGSYEFSHDRIKEAVYSSIAKDSLAQTHLEIGRLLVLHTPGERQEEAIFEIVNQLNRGSKLIVSRDEREQLAQLNLIAAKRAKRSTAYASAVEYLVAGSALQDSDQWEHRYQLTLELWLERAECEYLCGNFERAEGLIAVILSHARSKIDRSAAHRLRILLNIVKGEYRKAVESGLESLLLFGVDVPANPTREQFQVEYEELWRSLGERKIESLLDRPLMRNEEQQAAMQVLAEIAAAAANTDINLHHLIMFRMANLSLRSGTTAASSHGYAGVAVILATVFHRYVDAYRFATLACKLVEKHGFQMYRARAYLVLEVASLWKYHITTCTDLARLASRFGSETGDLSFACYACSHLISDLLFQGSHLDELWEESERCLQSNRKAGFLDAADFIVSRQRFIQCLRGNTTAFSTFNGDGFNEESFEAQLTENRLTGMVCHYWIFKLRARFMSGDYETAKVAARKAEPLLWSDMHIESVNFHYYRALTVAALHERREVTEELELLRESLGRLADWAASCPSNFLDKHKLVLAELARVEGRDLDAMRFYEEAIQAARENGFVQNEGIISERAASFYSWRGFDRIAQAYLRDARDAYLRWGAKGKVRQLEALHPHVWQAAQLTGRTSTIEAPLSHLDLATVTRAAQAVAGHLELAELIHTLLRLALEHAGADRGLLLLPQGSDLQNAAEACVERGELKVHRRPRPVTASELPDSLLRYVLRTRESVNLPDAAAGMHPFSSDAYLQRQRPRSVLVLPLVEQGSLRGLLYLENRLAPGVFTPERLALLELLAAQAAVALEHARLYTKLAQENRERQQAEAQLRDSEAKLEEAQHMARLGYWERDLDTDGITLSDETARIFGLQPQAEIHDLSEWHQRWLTLIHPEDRARTAEAAAAALQGDHYNEEYRITRPNGEVRIVHSRGNVMRDETGRARRIFGMLQDITERKWAEQRLLAQNRVTQILAESSTLAEATPLFLQALAECLGWDLGALWLVDRTAWVLRCATFWRRASVEVPEFEAATRAMTFQLGARLPGLVWLQREPVYLADLSCEASVSRLRLAVAEGLRAACAFPILLDAEVLGVVEFFSREMRRPDAELVKMMANTGSQLSQFIERKQVEDAWQKAQAELAHVSRVNTMGELAASIAHEVKQPLVGVVTNASACLRLLAGDSPDLVEAREALLDIVRDGKRAGDVLSRMRSLFTKARVSKERLNLNEAIEEVVIFTQAEARRNKVQIRTELEANLPEVMGDRVQIQQVLMNLILNSIEAMSSVEERGRDLVIRTRPNEEGKVKVAVQDSGIGLDGLSAERIFEAFYTTKPGGLGMGLSISRSIVESHGGRLWATANDGPGTTFQFTL